MWLLFALGAPLAGAAATAPSQPASQPTTQAATLPAAQAVNPADIQAAIAQLEQAKDIDPAVRSRAVELYRLALEEIKAADDWRAKAVSFIKAGEDAPAQLVAVKARLAEANTPAPPPDSALPLAQLEQQAAQAQAASSTASREAAQLEDEPKRRADRRAQIPQSVIAALGQLDESARELAAPAPPDQAPEVTTANHALLTAQRQTLQQQIVALRAESNAYELTQELLAAQRDYATWQLTEAQKKSQALQNALAQRRQADVQRVAQEARQAMAAAANAHPLTQRLAAENERLANSRTDPNSAAQGLEQARELFDRHVRELSRLRSEFKNIQQKVDAVGLSNSIGLLLRRERAMLPDAATLQREVKELKAKIADVQLEYLELRERRDALKDLDASVAELMPHAQPPIEAPQRDEITRAARKLLQNRRQYLDLLMADCNAYSAKLVDLNAVTGWLADETQTIGQYVDERVLWIRSAPPLYSMDGRQLLAAAQWLADPHAWSALAAELAGAVRANPVSTAVATLVLVSLLVFRRRMQARLTSIGQHVSRKPERFTETLGAALLTVLIVGLVPGMIALAALVLRHAVAPAELPLALASGLEALALGYLTTEILIQTCRPQGLAHAHFHWPTQSVNRLHGRLRALMAISLPILLLVATIEGQSVESRKDTLGRLFFIAGMGVLAFFIWRLLNPSGTVMRAVLEPLKTGWAYRLRRLWYGVLLAAPLALALTAFVGYYYPAVEIAWRMLTSLWLVLGMLVVYAVIDRWILVARRAAGRSEALNRLEAKQERRAERPDDAAAHAVSEAPPEVGLADMTKQSRRLVQWGVVLAIILGLGAIWADVVPALSVLKRVELGSYMEKAQMAIAKANGTTETQQIDRRIPVTLLDLAWAMIVLLGTLAAVRNVPGLMRMALLPRLRLDGGAIYAITTITRYIIIVTGIVTAFSLIGLAWSQVQWLAAAVTVGLGFGLQEIFANFVSGLIILFERPIRVGDVVTVGDIRGVVSKIRIRATTIVDRDHKELIVPNKAFITDKLVNWTLSDTMVRLRVPVNVALGPPPTKVKAMLEDVARSTPRGLADPPPQVCIVSMAANAMCMEVRVYVANLDDYRRCRDELLIAIEEKLRQAEIKIA